MFAENEVKKGKTEKEKPLIVIGGWKKVDPTTMFAPAYSTRMVTGIVQCIGILKWTP